MKPLTLLFMLIITAASHAVFYDEYEIQNQLQNKDLSQASKTFINDYFTSKEPNLVVNQLLKADLLPIKREYMLHSLLTAISQQPPQPFFQDFVNRMKTYEVVAMRSPDGGHSPQALFNISSKAHGVENIWIAYKTEQLFSQLFNKNLEEVVSAAREITNAESRPAWLGFKNSFSALAFDKQVQFAEYLNNQELIGSDRLVSFVGLNTQHIPLVKKALFSENISVREYTLRHLNNHLAYEDAKNLTVNAAKNGPDEKFSTSLLGQYVTDQEVQNVLINQLNNKTTADSAAFALSQVNDRELHEQLRTEFLKSNNQIAKNHILLALKLNRTESSNMVLSELRKTIKVESKSTQWLNSFEGNK